MRKIKMTKTNKKIQNTYGQDEIAAAVSAAGEAEIRAFLIQILQKDQTLFAKFQAAIGGLRLDISRYEKKIDMITQTYLGTRGYIPYQEANSFLDEMSAFLESDVEAMLEKEAYAQAFELSCYIFLKAGGVEIDDSDGGLGELLDECADIWETILEDADSKVRGEIFEWLTGHLDSGVSDYMEESMEQVLMDTFSDWDDSGDYTEKLLAYTKRKAQERRKETDSWNSGYYVQKWALYHIRMMEKAGFCEDEILKYCKEYWSYTKVRTYYIETCMKQKNYDQAIAALQESMQMDAAKPGQVSLFAEKLKEAYRMSGRQEDYKKQLWKLVTQDDPGNLDHFRELKSFYQEHEWKGVREEIFQALSAYAHPDRLYLEEGMYDRLLEYVLQAKGLYTLQKYENVLKKNYAEQILAKYEKELNEMAARAADRRRYQEWAALLRRMARIEGGDAKVHKIVADWRVRYKNRPAMIEELKQFGQ